jgi:hypothetical protein
MATRYNVATRTSPPSDAAVSAPLARSDPPFACRRRSAAPTGAIALQSALIDLVDSADPLAAREATAYAALPQHAT